MGLHRAGLSVLLLVMLAALPALFYGCSTSSTPIPPISGTATTISDPTEPALPTFPATPTPQPAESAVPSPIITTVTYEVQAGDTLSGIAERFSVRVDDIVKANNLTDPGHVEVGQRLAIPQSGTQTPVGGQASQPSSIPILMYHHVQELPEGANALERGLTVLPADFKEQMAFLASRGYVTVGLGNLIDAAAGNKTLPPKPIILTFDDGYTDAYADVFPILKEHGFVGTFYLLSGTVGYPGYMSWEQAKEMSDAGMDMEAHGIAHLDLTHISVESAREQITTSKTDLEARLGKPVTSYAYPSGKYNEGTLSLLRESGYSAAVTTKPGIARLSSSPLELPRIRVLGSMNINTFASVLGETP